MLEEKDIRAIKEKTCKEISKVVQKFDQQGDVSRADMETLCLALKIYEKTLNVESMEQTGYSGYSRAEGYTGEGYSGRRNSMGRFSRDSYDGGGSYTFGNSYDDHVIDEMMRHASPQERDVLSRMMRNMR